MRSRKRWYVIQTKYKQEDVAFANLRQQKFKTFFPKVSEDKMSRGVPVTVISPMFSGYIFVQFNIDKDCWRSITGTRGVLQLVTATEDRVSPLPDGFIENLLQASDRKGCVTSKKADIVLKKFSVGDEIIISEGIFQGYTGTCAKIAKGRADILIALLSDKKVISFPLNTISGA